MKLSEKEQEELIDGCVNGDRKYQQIVFKMYYGKMMGVCMRYAKDQDTAQDIVQDGFIKVFEKVNKFNKEGSFEGWIRRIMVNTAIDFFRKKKKDFILLEDDSRIKQEDDVDIFNEDSGAFYGIKPAMVMEAMAKLSPAYKTVFNLYVVENYTHAEIAEMLGVSVGTSKSNLSKAKLNLKKILLNNETKQL